MMDMAVGIIIGAAFGGIVSALVNDVIMPPIGLLLGKVDFANLFAAFWASAGRRGRTHRWRRQASRELADTGGFCCRVMTIRPKARRLRSVDLPVLGRPTMTTTYAVVAGTWRDGSRDWAAALGV
jgi:hypothetical protein